MLGGNTNISAQPYRPQHFDKQPSGENMYGYGMQRTAGQLAPQTATQGYNGNMMAGAMTQTPTMPNMQFQPVPQPTTFPYQPPQPQQPQPLPPYSQQPQYGNTQMGQNPATAQNFMPQGGWGNNPHQPLNLLQQYAQTPAGYARLSQPGHFAQFTDDPASRIDMTNLPRSYGY